MPRKPLLFEETKVSLHFASLLLLLLHIKNRKNRRDFIIMASLSFKRAASGGAPWAPSKAASGSKTKTSSSRSPVVSIQSRLQYMTADGGRRQKLEDALREEIPSSPGLSKNTQIALTKELLKNRFGRRCPELLAEDFVYDACYEKPKTKQEYLDFFANMNLQGGFPNSDYELLYDSMRVEWDTKVRQQQYKVWCTTQFKGKHTGDGLRMGKRKIPATGIEVESAPEICSFTYNSEGLCTRISAGYMADHAIGNTKGRGGYHGIFNAIGNPLPVPHSLHKMITDAFPPLLGFEREDMVWVVNLALFGLAAGGGDLRSLLPSKYGAKAKPASATSSLVSKQFAKGGKRHPLAPK